MDDIERSHLTDDEPTTDTSPCALSNCSTASVNLTNASRHREFTRDLLALILVLKFAPAVAAAIAILRESSQPLWSTSALLVEHWSTVRPPKAWKYSSQVAGFSS